MLMKSILDSYLCHYKTIRSDNHPVKYSLMKWMSVDVMVFFFKSKNQILQNN